MRVKTSASQVEVFLNLERIALHVKTKGLLGRRILDHSHLPENRRAFREVTPQNLLSQAKFVHPQLHELIEKLFEKDTLGNLRRVQGLLRKAHSVIQQYGRSQAEP